MKIMQFLKNLIAENRESLDKECVIEDREGRSLTFSKGQITGIILRFELSSEELCPLILLAVRLKSNISLVAILKSGADCNCRDENGDTPLIWAVRNRNKEIVELLLDYGADPFIKNHQSIGAIGYALKQPEILMYFEKRYSLVSESGSIIFMLYEQAIQTGSDILARKFLDMAFELKYDTAMRIVDHYPDNTQNSHIKESNINKLFKPISNEKTKNLTSTCHSSNLNKNQCPK